MAAKLRYVISLFNTYAKNLITTSLFCHSAGGGLFADPEFPPAEQSLCIKGLPPPSFMQETIEWRRPQNFGSKPTHGQVWKEEKNPYYIHIIYFFPLFFLQAFVDGIHCCDIRQGALGDW